LALEAQPEQRVITQGALAVQHPQGQWHPQLAARAVRETETVAVQADRVLLVPLLVAALPAAADFLFLALQAPAVVRKVRVTLVLVMEPAVAAVLPRARRRLAALALPVWSWWSGKS
jgi:hypothetical protein